MKNRIDDGMPVAAAAVIAAAFFAGVVFMWVVM